MNEQMLDEGREVKRRWWQKTPTWSCVFFLLPRVMNFNASYVCLLHSR
jgi:hypothetical protein